MNTNSRNINFSSVATDKLSIVLENLPTRLTKPASFVSLNKSQICKNTLSGDCWQFVAATIKHFTVSEARFSESLLYNWTTESSSSINFLSWEASKIACPTKGIMLSLPVKKVCYNSCRLSSNIVKKVKHNKR